MELTLLDQIIAIFFAAAPSIASIIGTIMAVHRAFKMHKENTEKVNQELREIKEEVINTKEYKDLKAQLVVVHQENVELKKNLNELLTKIDRVSRVHIKENINENEPKN